jgi:hypothetical protein
MFILSIKKAWSLLLQGYKAVQGFGLKFEIANVSGTALAAGLERVVESTGPVASAIPLSESVVRPVFHFSERFHRA